jgi:hypothetical protein
MEHFLAQPTIWGLTVGQTVAVLGAAAGLVILWTALGLVLRLAGTVIRVGCALILVLSCGCLASTVLVNLAKGVFK